MNKTVSIVAPVIFGLICFGVAFVYLTTKASALPVFFPGHNALSSVVHIKHGLGILILGLGSLVLAWFQTGKKTK